MHVHISTKLVFLASLANFHEDNITFLSFFRQIVAVRQLDRSGTQASKEFQVEVLMLSLLQHPNLVSLIGYCADGEQRLLVYEYMPAGSLKNFLFGTVHSFLTHSRLQLYLTSGSFIYALYAL